MFDVTIDDHNLTVELEDEYSSRLDRSIVRGLNRSTTAGVALMARLIAGDTGLKVGDVKAALRVETATLSRPQASIASSLRRLPLIKWLPESKRVPVPSRGRGRGVSVRLIGGTGRYPHAFVARMPGTGHVGVYSRVNPTGGEDTISKRRSAGAWSKNLPIYQLHGPSLGRVFRTHRAETVERMRSQFMTVVDHEMRWRAEHGAGGET